MNLYKFIFLFVILFLFASCSQKDIWSNAESDVDGNPPAISNLVVLNNITLELYFSEELEKSSAETPSNYNITNNLTVESATLNVDNKTVVLKTSSQTDADYYITVTSVDDLYGNNIDNCDDLSMRTWSFIGHALPSIADVASTGEFGVRATFSAKVDISKAVFTAMEKVDGDDADTDITTLTLTPSDTNLSSGYLFIADGAQSHDTTYIFTAENVVDLYGDSLAENRYNYTGNPTYPYITKTSAVSNKWVCIKFSEEVQFPSAPSITIISEQGIETTYNAFQTDLINQTFSANTYEIYMDTHPYDTDAYIESGTYNITGVSGISDTDGNAINLADPNSRDEFEGIANPCLLSAGLSSAGSTYPEIKIVYSKAMSDSAVDKDYYKILDENMNDVTDIINIGFADDTRSVVKIIIGSSIVSEKYYIDVFKDNQVRDADGESDNDPSTRGNRMGKPATMIIK